MEPLRGEEGGPLIEAGFDALPEVVRDDLQLGRLEAEPLGLMALALLLRTTLNDFLTAVPDDLTPIQRPLGLSIGSLYVASCGWLVPALASSACASRRSIMGTRVSGKRMPSSSPSRKPLPVLSMHSA